MHAYVVLNEISIFIPVKCHFVLCEELQSMKVKGRDTLNRLGSLVFKIRCLLPIFKLSCDKSRLNSWQNRWNIPAFVVSGKILLMENNLYTSKYSTTESGILTIESQKN